MKRQQLVTLLCVAAAVVVLCVIVSAVRQRSWGRSGSESDRLVLPDLENTVNDIVKIEVTDKDGTVHVVKKDNRWRIEERFDYPANYDRISEFLRDLIDLKVAQTVNIGESQYGRLELLTPGGEDKDKCGTKVVFYDAGDKPTGTLLLGKEHEKKSDSSAAPSMYGGGSWPDGRYVLVPDTKKVVLVSETFSSVVGRAKDWLNKDFFKVGDMKSGVLREDGKEAWRVEREKKGDDMKLVGLAEGEKQDDTDVRGIGNAFSWASFEDIADPALGDAETGMDKPKEFTATDFDGFTYVVKVGKETSDGKSYMSVAVDYEGPKEREPEEGESEEDKTKKDEEFKKKQDESQEKASELKRLVDDRTGKPWVYIVSKYTAEKILKERKDLIKEPEKKDEDKDKSVEKKDEAKSEDKAEAAKPAEEKPAAAAAAAAAQAKAVAEDIKAKAETKAVEAKSQVDAAAKQVKDAVNLGLKKATTAPAEKK